ncbi:hypothetical protein H7169_00085 [Candidatus Gracilibacteria bacterium]|nr:hypothetical protein [Candidatus Gracilibacteria bacterium]
MSETDTQPSSLVLNSVAERLRAAGFRQTGIARAVTELVGAYLGVHTNMSHRLTIALGTTNSDALDLLSSQTNTIPVSVASVVNDGNIIQSTTIVANDEKLTEAA